jgi:hypothetical protein
LLDPCHNSHTVKEWISEDESQKMNPDEPIPKVAFRQIDLDGYF